MTRNYEKLVSGMVALGEAGDIEPLRDALELCRAYEKEDAITVIGVDGNT